MVKFYEAILLLFASLVILKSRGLESSNKITTFNNPFTSLLDNAQSQAIIKGKSNIETLENVRLSNLDIAQSILKYQQGLRDVDISDIQNELTKTQQYLSSAVRVQPGTYSGYDKYLNTWKATDLVKKFDNMYNYFLRGGEDSSGQSPITYGLEGLQIAKIFPNIDLTLNPSVREGFVKQAEYELAQASIQPALNLITKQQNEIQRLQMEYERDYGVLSRYG